jgi:hypothetical protein
LSKKKVSFFEGKKSLAFSFFEGKKKVYIHDFYYFKNKTSGSNLVAFIV